MDAQLVYLTFPNAQAATEAAHLLLKERLIACANILPGACSLYRWEGKIEEAEETVMIAKTVERQVNKIVDKVRAIHPYTCPCVISTPITAGNPAFLEWIMQETA